METERIDAVDDVVASFGTHGVIGLVVMLCVGLGAGMTAWIVFHRTFDAVPQSQNEAALIASTQEDALSDSVQNETTARGSVEVPPYVAPAILAPTARIELIGDSVVYVGSGESYTDDGAVFSDSSGDEEGVVRSYVNGTLVDTVVIDTSVSGTHEIEYRTEDSEGNRISTTRSVVVR